MSKLQSTLMLLMLGTSLAACASDPSEPTTTTPPGDQLSAILSTPGPAKECIDVLPPPVAGQQKSPDDPCPDSGSACGNSYPLVWCKADGAPAIAQCEKSAWVLKVKKCP